MKLAQRLDLGAAAPLKQALLAARGAAIAIDASDVEHLGALCLQALLAAKAAWANDSCAFRIIDPSPAFLEAGRLMMGEHRLAEEGASA
ncbi:MAG: STAS domain-containing protein [Hyphomonadaceae bacterium JAD_PAG50586_4]|nr:MAG: STAS domain-containing protein [Hyphomonadaceae bacterium JAD_PAG50586_4]